MPVTEDEMIVATKDYLMTENTLNPKATPAEVDAFLRSCKTTGRVTFTKNNGGTRNIVVVEQTAISDEESNEVRRVLGMDYEVPDEEEPPVSRARVRKVDTPPRL